MKITIQKFQQLHPISEAETDHDTFTEIDKSVKLVSVLTGKSEAEVNRMSSVRFGLLCKSLNKKMEGFYKKLANGKPRNYVWANGKPYYINYDITNSAQYVEAAVFGSDIVGNLHKIIATMAHPIGLTGVKKKKASDHERIANDFLKADFEIPYHAAVFFCALFMQSIEAIQPYILSKTENKSQTKAVLDTLPKILDGFTMPKWYQNLKISQ